MLRPSRSSCRIRGLLEGETTARANINYNTFLFRDNPGPFKLYCEYHNRFGDRYRVEIPLHRSTQSGWRPEGVENTFVWFNKAGSGEWLKQEG